MPIDFEKARRDLPEIANQSDTEIAELIELSDGTIRGTLSKLKRAAQELRATELDEQKAAA